MRIHQALSIVAFGALLFGSPTVSFAEGTLRALDRLEASVNASTILTSDIQRFRDSFNLRSRLDPLFAYSSLSEKGERATNQEILESLIHDRLVLLAFPVTDAEVEQEINSIQSSQKISRQRLKDELQKNGFPFEYYFELIRLSTAKRNLIDREIRSKVSVSEEEIQQQFVKRFSDKPVGPSSYRIKMISFSRSSFKTAQALNDTAKRAVIALKSGDSFEEVARRFGDADSPGGETDLGVLTENQMSPLIRSEVKKLKAGGVSGLFGNPRSTLMIIKLVEISKGEDPRLASVREEIHNQLAAAEYQHQIQLWLARQEQRAFIHRASAL